MVSAGAMAQPERARRAPVAPAEPVVVELFTAQGYSGCPQANAVVETLSERPGVIALTYAVDYWDYLGWPDTFAKPEFAERQRSYQSALRVRNIYTPQIIIDGHVQMPGSEETAVQAAVNLEGERRAYPPQIEFRGSGDQVGIGSGRAPQGGAEVWIVRYKTGSQTVAVRQGDNRGQSVRHINVVQSLTKIGDWNGRPMLYALPDDVTDDDGLAVLVQARSGRRILMAAQR